MQDALTLIARYVAYSSFGVRHGNLRTIFNTK